MIGYVKCFDSNKAMSFKVSDNKLLRKYNRIWERVSNLLSIKFDSKPVYGDNDKYIKTKIKLYGEKINANFQGKKISKEHASYKCLSLIMLNSVIRANKKSDSQTLLKEFKYEIKKNKMKSPINDDLDPSSSDDSDIKSYNEFDNEESNDNDKSNDKFELRLCFNNNNNNNNNNKSLIVCINYALLGFYLY